MQPQNVGGHASEDPRKNAKQKAIFTFHLILFKNAKAVENANDFCVVFCLHICLQIVVFAFFTLVVHVFQVQISRMILDFTT